MGESITFPLPCGREVIIDADDWPLVSKYAWSSRDGRNGVFYAATTVALPDGRVAQVLLHRLILKPGTGVEIDHWNRNGLDCRTANLRVTSVANNAQNRLKHSNGRPPYKGISFDARRCANPWSAFINVDRVKRRLGAFETAEEAARAYDAAARIHFGEFARVNFPQAGEESAIENLSQEEIAQRIAEFDTMRREPRKSGRPRKSDPAVEAR